MQKIWILKDKLKYECFLPGPVFLHEDTFWAKNPPVYTSKLGGGIKNKGWKVNVHRGVFQSTYLQQTMYNAGALFQ